MNAINFAQLKGKLLSLRVLMVVAVFMAGSTLLIGQDSFNGPARTTLVAEAVQAAVDLQITNPATPGTFNADQIESVMGPYVDGTSKGDYNNGTTQEQLKYQYYSEVRHLVVTWQNIPEDWLLLSLERANDKIGGGASDDDMRNLYNDTIDALND